MKLLFTFMFLSATCQLSIAQSVGIGTTTPNAFAALHVDVPSANNGLLVTGTINTSVSTIPDLGAGSRMMFYPGRSAFRAGYISSGGTQWNNTNVGFSSAAFGRNTLASGDWSFATGYNTTAAGTVSHATGYETTANGNYSMAMNAFTHANGTYSTAIGLQTTAAGHASASMGYNTITNGYSSTVVGMYNDPVNSTPEIAVSNLTPLFIVGNGDINSRSNALVAYKSGNIAIGSNNAQARLDITTNSSISYPQLMLYESANDFARLSFRNTAGSTFWTVAGLPQQANAASLLNFYFSNFGDVLSLRGDGTAWLAGTLTQNSDARLKRNIEPITNAMQQLRQVNGYHYYWHDKQRDSNIQTGILAQEIKAVFPELVKADANGTLSVNYSGLIPYVIEAAKEQQQQIDDLKARLQKLEEAVFRLAK